MKIIYNDGHVGEPVLEHVSTITDVPSATHAAASIWACMSVGKPG